MKAHTKLPWHTILADGCIEVRDATGSLVCITNDARIADLIVEQASNGFAFADFKERLESVKAIVEDKETTKEAGYAEIQGLVANL